MPPTIVATPGDANANSYATRARAQAYFDTRLYATNWTGASDTDKDIALIMATRVIDASLSARRTWVASEKRFRIRPTWTGTRAATNLSRLAWTRAGMFDRNGIAIPETVIPDELADATAELAGQLLGSDRTANSAVIDAGLTDLRVGPVALGFKDDFHVEVLPDAVLDLLVPSWFTEEVYESGLSAFIKVL